MSIDLKHKLLTRHIFFVILKTVMENINIVLAGKHINNNAEYYHVVFKAKVDDNIFSYIDFRLNKIENNKYEFFLNIDLVNSPSFGNIKDKYILNSSSYENKITHISDKKYVYSNLDDDLKIILENIMQRSNNVYFSEVLNFSLNHLKTSPKYINEIPSFVLECINNRNKFGQEKNF